MTVTTDEVIKSKIQSSRSINQLEEIILVYPQ